MMLFLAPTKPKMPARVLFFICQKIRGNCFHDGQDAITLPNNFFYKLNISNLTKILASSHHKNNQKHSNKQIKDHTLACASATSHSDLSFHCFCKCKKLLYNFTSKIHNLDKAIFHTHKIKSKKEYEFSKQKNNRNVIVSLFSVLKIHTLSEEPHLSEQHF
jgi:hypothetical protein